MRLGPAYFPFVEPGAEVGVSCFLCDGVGLPRVRQRLDRAARAPGWSIRRSWRTAATTRSATRASRSASGIERVALLRYAIPDMRMLVDGDVRFLAQFGATP